MEKVTLKELEAALNILELPLKTDIGTLVHQWQQLRSQHHPDKGGTAENFDRLLRAYQTASKGLNQTRPCHLCEGTGQIFKPLPGTFESRHTHCKACRGTGRVSTADWLRATKAVE